MDAIRLKKCSSGYKCDMESNESLGGVDVDFNTHYCVTKDTVIFQRYPGESCTASASCYRGICSGGVCVGKETGSD